MNSPTEEEVRQWLKEFKLFDADEEVEDIRYQRVMEGYLALLEYVGAVEGLASALGRLASVKLGE